MKRNNGLEFLLMSADSIDRTDQPFLLNNNVGKIKLNNKKKTTVTISYPMDKNVNRA